MRLLTWNINGIKTLPKYHPWNTLPTFNDILQKLEADIICFQEMKTSRKLFTKDTATPASFDAFVSLPIKKTGYSGVATYTRSSSVVPLKAEEGLTGILQPKPPLSSEERISSPDTYPPRLLEDAADHTEEEELDFQDLDSEGRAIVLDFGLFVLINTYCPNDGGTPEREKYKMEYHKLLSTRVKGLIEREKREVIVVGDLNACAAVIDHCEGDLMVAKGHAEGLEGEDGFWGKGYRRWLRDWVAEGGPLVDAVRKFWPERKGMYTCWNTKLSARETNYGTRIDFILVTPGLVPWIKAADTLPSIKGSDHCPVYVDFHDEINDAEGRTIRLQDALGMNDGQGVRAPPRLCARFWEEFSGKQTSLAQFFGSGKGKVTPSPSPSATAPTPTPTPSAGTPLENVSMSDVTTCNAAPAEPIPPVGAAIGPTANPPSTSTKRKFVPEPANVAKKSKKDKKPGQQSIANFFSKPTASNNKSTASSSTVASATEPTTMDVDCDEDEDYKLALQLSQQYDLSSPQSSQSSSSNRKGKQKQDSKDAWTSLLAPIQPPNCRGHGEPAKEFTVNKPGPNKGKKFFICPRPVGPGYDKGKSERLREHVDPQYRCDFFKWSSDVRREQTLNGKGTKGP